MICWRVKFPAKQNCMQPFVDTVVKSIINAPARESMYQSKINGIPHLTILPQSNKLKKMMIPKIAFMAAHVVNLAEIALAFPSKYLVPLCIFGAISCLPEHYADVFPSVFAIGQITTAIVFVLMMMHYYYAFKIIDKRIFWASLAPYVALTIFAFATDFG